MASNVGKILWQDLTVANAAQTRDFYQQVIGWQSDGVDMGGYQDFAMKPADSQDSVAGICHAKGPNADMPPQWILYFGVDNLDQSLTQVKAMGGEQVTEIRSYGGDSRFAVIRDPADAVCALFEQR